VRGGEDRIGGLPGPNLPYRAAGARLDHRAILRLQRAAGNRSLAAFIPLMRVQHEPAAPVQGVKIDETAARDELKARVPRVASMENVFLDTWDTGWSSNCHGYTLYGSG